MAPIADAKNLLSILLRDRMRPAVEWSVRTASANSSFEELPLRAGPLEALHCRGVDFAVVVVGRFEPNDHVPLCLVVANARDVTALFNVHTREGVKCNGPVIFDWNGFRRGDLAYQDKRRNDDESQRDLQGSCSVRARRDGCFWPDCSRPFPSERAALKAGCDWPEELECPRGPSLCTPEPMEELGRFPPKRRGRFVLYGPAARFSASSSSQQALRAASASTHSCSAQLGNVGGPITDLGNESAHIAYRCT